MLRRGFVASLFFFIAFVSALFGQDYLDPSKPIEVRVKDLIGRLTVDEKIRQMGNAVPAIPRLGVASYDYWSEALHGVARQGLATVFPQAVGLGATWDLDSPEDHHGRLHRGARQGQHGFPPVPHLLEPDHQPAPRPALGPRGGGLLRGPVPHRPDGRRLH